MGTISYFVQQEGEEKRAEDGRRRTSNSKSRTTKVYKVKLTRLHEYSHEYKKCEKKCPSTEEKGT